MTEFAKALFRGGKSPSPTLESLTSQMFSAEEMKEASGSRTTSGRSSTAQVLAGLPAASSSRDSPAAISAIERYGFHSTCLQIKDPIKSIKFYTKVLGMEVVKETDSDEYSMYFLAFQPKNVAEGEADFGSRTGLLQLVHVHGSEDDDSFRIVTGHPGFSHFSISVPDVDRARLRMEKLGVEIVEDGSNARGFAAVADPDGYHIQLIAQNVGQDDKLRAQLEKLMSEPAQDSFGFPQPSAPDEVPDSLRFAKGGSPVSPRSPN